MTKLKNSNGDKTKKKQIVTKLKNINCDETQKFRIRETPALLTNADWRGCKKNPASRIREKTQIVIVVKVTVVAAVVTVKSFSKDNSTTDEKFSGQLFMILAMFSG